MPLPIFVVKQWKPKPDPSTPLSAAALIDAETRLSAHTDSVGAYVDGRVTALAADVDAAEATVGGFAAQITALQSTATGHGGRLNALEAINTDSRLDALEAAAGFDASALLAADAALDARLDAIEAANYGGQLTTLSGTVGGHTTTLASHTTQLNSYEDRIVDLESAVPPSVFDPSDLEAADAALDTRVDAVEAAATSLDGRLDAVEPALVSLDGRVDALEEDSGGSGGPYQTRLENAIYVSNPSTWWQLGVGGNDMPDYGSNDFTLDGVYYNRLSQVGPQGTSSIYSGNRSSDGIGNAGDVYDFAGDASFTAMIFFKPNTDTPSSNYQRIFSKEGAWWIACDTNSLGYRPARGATNGAAMQAISPHAWNMLALAYDSANDLLYSFINGRWASVADSTSNPNNTNPLIVGGTPAANAQSTLPGDYAHPVIWERFVPMTELLGIWRAAH